MYNYLYENRHVVLYDLENEEMIAKYTFDKEPSNVCVSPNGNYLLVSLKDLYIIIKKS